MRIKGFDRNLTCRGFQFEVGKTYDTGAADDEIELCSDTVFHYCDDIMKVDEFYSARPRENNRFCEIEVMGREISDGSKYGSNRIKIIREIKGEELDILRGTQYGNTGVFNIGGGNVGNFNIGDYNVGDYNEGHWNVGKRNKGKRNEGYCNEGSYNEGCCNVGCWNIGNYNKGNCNIGCYNIGDYNTGMFNICDFSSGFFCTVEPKARIFDIETDTTVSEFRDSKYYDLIKKYDFILTEWINYTKEEKKADKYKACIGGYLKRYSYTEACQNWWNQFTDEEKEFFMTIPNFDKDKFKMITGIEV